MDSEASHSNVIDGIESATLFRIHWNVVRLGRLKINCSLRH
jgi:hypothetical protein